MGERQRPERDEVYKDTTMVRYHDRVLWPSVHDGEIFRVVGRRQRPGSRTEVEYQIVNQWGDELWACEYDLEIISQDGMFPGPPSDDES